MQKIISCYWQITNAHNTKLDCILIWRHSRVTSRKMEMIWTLYLTIISPFVHIFLLLLASLTLYISPSHLLFFRFLAPTYHLHTISLFLPPVFFQSISFPLSLSFSSCLTISLSLLLCLCLFLFCSTSPSLHFFLYFSLLCFYLLLCLSIFSLTISLSPPHSPCICIFVSSFISLNCTSLSSTSPPPTVSLYKPFFFLAFLSFLFINPLTVSLFYLKNLSNWKSLTPIA